MYLQIPPREETAIADEDQGADSTTAADSAESETPWFDTEQNLFDPVEDAGLACAPWLMEARLSAAAAPSTAGQTASDLDPMDVDLYSDFLLRHDAAAEESDDSYQTDDEKPATSSKRPAVPAKRPPPAATLGSGSSQKRVRRDAGTQKPHSHKPAARTPEAKLAAFKEKVLQLDSCASFDPNNIRRVRCGRCSNWCTMHTPYELERLVAHRKTKRCTKQTTSTKSLADIFRGALSSRLPLRSPAPRVNLPCPGLTAEVQPLIATYLRRTPVPGGGAPSRTKLAEELYRKPYVDLSSHQKRRVRSAEAHRYRWVNRHGLQAVFAKHCVETVRIAADQTPPPCATCRAVLRLKAFKNALAHTPTPEENLKFVPKCYREQDIGELYLRFHGLRELVDDVSWFSVYHCRADIGLECQGCWQNAA